MRSPSPRFLRISEKLKANLFVYYSTTHVKKMRAQEAGGPQNSFCGTGTCSGMCERDLSSLACSDSWFLCASVHAVGGRLAYRPLKADRYGTHTRPYKPDILNGLFPLPHSYLEGGCPCRESRACDAVFLPPSLSILPLKTALVMGLSAI